MKKVSVVFVMLSMLVMAILPSCKEDEPEAAKAYDGIYYVTNVDFGGALNGGSVEMEAAQQTMRVVFSIVGGEYYITTQIYDSEKKEWTGAEDATLKVGSYDGYKELREGVDIYKISSLDENNLDITIESTNNDGEVVTIHYAAKK